MAARKEELVMRDPKLATLIKWSCNAICMIQLAVYIGLVIFLFTHQESSLGQAIGYSALAAPPVVGAQFGFSFLKEIYIKKYAMGPPRQSGNLQLKKS
ncbi:hypothetical protein EJB05_42299 [Eragrostis curvula]|uniref:Uncharacterized protein n=1 Tax=Eragrostis curvula TaxID=38414 RepID=A0A5J9TBX8_9POAL|nr:hypothetical protein EJB05_42299 [Eragrostis curvula]